MYYIDPTIIIRNPSYPLNRLEHVDMKSIILSDYYFKKAIEFASPSLSQALKKYINGELSPKEVDKVFASLYRYYIRMCSRCTPFGLFSSYSVERIDSSNSSTNVISDDKTIFITMDSLFLEQLIQSLLKDSNIRENIIYYANDSICYYNKSYHYFETNKSIESSDYNYSQISYSKETEHILTQAKYGIKLIEIRNYLIALGYEEEIVEDYILDLIDSSVIISEWELCVTKQNLIQRIMAVLVEIDSYKLIQELLSFFIRHEKNTDDILKENIQYCSSLINKIPAFKGIVKTHSPFNITLRRYFEQNISLPSNVMDEIIEGIDFLSSITPQISNNMISNFKKDFYSRYGERRVPLLEALDLKIGIRYPNYYPSSEDLLINKIKKNSHNNNRFTIEDKSNFIIFLDKVIQGIKKGKEEIVISKEDFFVNDKIKKYPPSFSLLAELFKKEDNFMYHFRSIGFISAGCLISRFGYKDSCVENQMLRIAKHEEKENNNEIIAELTFAPEARVANILQRPNVRKYQIICNSNVEHEERKNAIFLSDLDLLIKNGKLKLYSRKLNKFIIPYNTTAHNYKTSKYPAYLLLSDMQSEYYQKSIFVEFNKLRDFFDYIPRLRYKKCIISTAAWKIHVSDISNIMKGKEKNECKLEQIYLWRKRKHIPTRVLYSDGSDNLLLIDWNSINSIEIFINITRSVNIIWVQEFLYDSYTSVACDTKGNYYANEFVFTIYNDSND